MHSGSKSFIEIATLRHMIAFCGSSLHDPTTLRNALYVMHWLTVMMFVHANGKQPSGFSAMHITMHVVRKSLFVRNGVRAKLKTHYELRTYCPIP